MTEKGGPTPYEAAFEPNDYDKWSSVVRSSTPYAPAVLDVFEEVTDVNRRQVISLTFREPNMKSVRLGANLIASDEEVFISTDGSNVVLEYPGENERHSLEVNGFGNVRIEGIHRFDGLQLEDRVAGFLGVAGKVHGAVREIKRKMVDSFAVRTHPPSPSERLAQDHESLGQHHPD